MYLSENQIRAYHSATACHQSHRIARTCCYGTTDTYPNRREGTWPRTPAGTPKAKEVSSVTGCGSEDS
jgi:hypothetical protein